MATSEGDKSIQQLEDVWSKVKNLSAVAKCHQKLLVSNYVKLCYESKVFLERATADFLMECLDNEDIETGAHTEEKVGTVLVVSVLAVQDSTSRQRQGHYLLLWVRVLMMPFDHSVVNLQGILYHSL